MMVFVVGKVMKVIFRDVCANVVEPQGGVN